MSTTIAETAEVSKSTRRRHSLLRDGEKWWRDRFELLEKHGYRLRPRYRPDWVPSWIETDRSPLYCEDHVFSKSDEVLDAVRVADGKVVSIKRVKIGTQELEIARFLSERQSDTVDPMNHCVPVLDHFVDEALPEFAFLVMPLLRWFDNPPFFSVDEVVDFIRQTLEGLVYMHKQGVAHRDCSSLNIMLEASPMYPRGFHPVSTLYEPDYKKFARYRRRRDSPGIKYYFIDYGISTRFRTDTAKDERLVTGFDGQDREVPELSHVVPYDPFAVDVFVLGNVYRRHFLEKYSNLTFLEELVSTMTNRSPEKRPSADEALNQFTSTLAKQPGIRLRWRLKEKDTGSIRGLVTDVDSAARKTFHLAKQLMRFPLALSKLNWHR